MRRKELKMKILVTVLSLALFAAGCGGGGGGSPDLSLAVKVTLRSGKDMEAVKLAKIVSVSWERSWTSGHQVDSVSVTGLQLDNRGEVSLSLKAGQTKEFRLNSGFWLIYTVASDGEVDPNPYYLDLPSGKSGQWVGLDVWTNGSTTPDPDPDPDPDPVPGRSGLVVHNWTATEVIRLGGVNTPSFELRAAEFKYRFWPFRTNSRIVPEDLTSIDPQARPVLIDEDALFFAMGETFAQEDLRAAFSPGGLTWSMEVYLEGGRSASLTLADAVWEEELDGQWLMHWYVQDSQIQIP
ncbi:MAG: hypothetical protein COU10_00390 [Candidatus Harrisonbacteria bacterium CG10_big_fil_rev_8_21_14_0_10_45_28]|uniref:Uncharacterized protein n=1 Tax=Candidatus Harrisonbacteria bacterium CG10_big_fil_rev_8_21_14_0_10_45_28 TaxID=1974586 RepID=A0A2H0UQZ7_9BACT|nr:MAG: hypothetical protein COU10_00390 [Candidatus Harrisonbacteria bacterium CG10_big_fil_rev_8_21_14_0_10_45_28]